MPRKTQLVAFIAAMSLLGLGTVPSQAAPFAYIPNERSNNVSVIDTATNMVVATVPVGVIPIGVTVPPGRGLRAGNTSPPPMGGRDAFLWAVLVAAVDRSFAQRFPKPTTRGGPPVSTRVLLALGMAVMAHNAATLVRIHEYRLSKRARTFRRRLRLRCRHVNQFNASIN